MGYSDYKLVLSSLQAVAVDAISGSTIDFELTNPPLKWGYPMGVKLSVNVVTTPDTTGLDVLLCWHSAAPTDGTYVFATFKIPTAQLVVNKEFILPIPQGITPLRHFGVYYNLLTGDGSYTLSAYLTPYPATGV